MSIASGSSTTKEDVSWHQPTCVYRKFIEEDRQSSFLADEDMRKELEHKYRKEALRAHASADREKKKNKKRRLLTPEEDAFVKNKVAEAMDHQGSIRWYLDSQRKELDQVKTRYKEQCTCIKVVAEKSGKESAIKEREEAEEVASAEGKTPNVDGNGC